LAPNGHGSEAGVINSSVAMEKFAYWSAVAPRARSICAGVPAMNPMNEIHNGGTSANVLSSTTHSYQEDAYFGAPEHARTDHAIQND
jgi:hypothetical protein